MTTFNIGGTVTVPPLPDEELVWKRYLGHVYDDLRCDRRIRRTLGAKPVMYGYLALTTRRLLFLPTNRDARLGALVRDVPVEEIRRVESERGGGVRGALRGMPDRCLLVSDANDWRLRFAPPWFESMAAVAEQLNAELRRVRREADGAPAGRSPPVASPSDPPRPLDPSGRVAADSGGDGFTHA